MGGQEDVQQLDQQRASVPDDEQRVEPSGDVDSDDHLVVTIGLGCDHATVGAN
jgi:hypothetical protein